MFLPTDVGLVELGLSLCVLGQFFQALLGGFSEGSRADRAQKSIEADRQAELQNRILTSLAQSPDADVQALALTALLSGEGTQAKGKKGVSGLGGFITEIQQNPILPALSALINTPDPNTGGQPDVEGFLGSSGVTSPIEQPTAAQAPRGTVEKVPGQSPVQQLPPFQPTQTTTTPGPPGSGTNTTSISVGEPIGRPTQLPPPGPGGPVPTTPQEPRQIFPGPEQAGETAAAERAGTIRGVLEALNIDPATDLTEEERTAVFRGALGAPQGTSKPLNVIWEDGSPGAVIMAPDGNLVDVATMEAPTQGIQTFVPDAAFGASSSQFSGRSQVEAVLPDGTRVMRKLDPQGNVIFEVPIADEAVPASPFPFQTGGTITDDDGVERQVTRDRDGNFVVGLPTGNQGEPQSVADAKGFERALASFKRRRAQGFGVPPSQELIDAEVDRLSDGLYKTEGELSSAAASGVTRPREFQSVVPGGGVVPPGTQSVPVVPSSPGVGDPAQIRDTLDRLRRELQEQQLNPQGR